MEEHSLSTQESNNAGAISNQSSQQYYSILPLLGNPYFTCVVVKSQVQNPYQLVIPRNFYQHLPKATLQSDIAHQGRTWEVKYHGESSNRRFTSGWKEFAMDNHLKVGDGCVFELMDAKKLKFRVQILDGQIPSRITKKGSAEQPIVLD